MQVLFDSEKKLILGTQVGIHLIEGTCVVWVHLIQVSLNDIIYSFWMSALEIH